MGVMTTVDIARSRLANQRITAHPSVTPQDVVAALGAMQAQDYRGALWAVGLRLPGLSRFGVEGSIARAEVVRTWAMRGTLHLIAPADVRWVLALLAPRVIAQSASRRRQLEIDDVVLSRSGAILAAALSGGASLTRSEALGLLRRAGIGTTGQRGIHILRHLSLEGLLCQLAFRERQTTFVLLDDRVPASEPIDRGEALAGLAGHYFAGHGPATLKDFAWWSGLTVADARSGLEGAATALVSEKVGDSVYWMSRRSSPAPEAAPSVCLVPGFDEYILGYADREVAMDAAAARLIVPGSNGLFRPAILLDGRVVGTWRLGTATRPASAVDLLAPLDGAATRALDAALRANDAYSTGTAASA